MCLTTAVCDILSRWNGSFLGIPPQYIQMLYIATSEVKGRKLVHFLATWEVLIQLACSQISLRNLCVNEEVMSH